MCPDFYWEVHCILGLTFDAVDIDTAVEHIRTSTVQRSPCFVSTPNLNFLIASQSDIEFRNSVLNSDLSVADGMPIVWIARLLGIPILERVAGSGLFEKLREESSTKLKIYFFGGVDGVAEIACKNLNMENSGLTCVGFESPGFASVEKMSSEESINKINSSNADFLVVSLGAKKGQAWIEHNREKISVPVLSHLGAVVNFVAGKLNRAPVWVQNSGLEWLWRIKEEPALWRRYASDGVILIRLIITRIIPYLWVIYLHKPSNIDAESPDFDFMDDGDEIVIRLRGAWLMSNMEKLRDYLSISMLVGKNIRLDFQHVTYVDSAFIGLLLLIYGDRKRQGRELIIEKMQNNIRQIFKFSGVEYLLNTL